MRFKRLNRFLLLLAALFVLAVLQRSDLPGEEVLPDVYRATVHEPLLAPMAAAANEEALDVADLRSRLAVAERQVRELTEQIERTHELQGYFEKLHWEKRPKALPAWVFAVEADEYRRTFKIDRGTAHGVREGQAVVIGQALLGVVLGADPNTALVRRVDDPSFRMEVEIEAEGEVVRGVAQGDGDRGVDVRFVPRTGTVRAGQRAFTSRYHDLIPPGLYVGDVEGVRDLDEDGLHEIALRPAAALGRWAQVHVVIVPERPGR